MYCSGCGTRIQEGLNYCSRCGKRAAEEGQNTASIAESLSSSLGYVGGFGFLSFVFVVLVLVKNGVSGGQIIPIAFFYFAALFGICFLILRQTQLFSKSPKRNAKNETQENLHAYLRPVTTAQLQEPADHPASVTEHTTRTLDEVPVRRNA